MYNTYILRNLKFFITGLSFSFFNFYNSAMSVLNTIHINTIQINTICCEHTDRPHLAIFLWCPVLNPNLLGHTINALLIFL